MLWLRQPEGYYLVPLLLIHHHRISLIVNVFAVDKLGHEILMEPHMYLLNSFTGVL